MTRTTFGEKVIGGIYAEREKERMKTLRYGASDYGVAAIGVVLILVLFFSFIIS